jgi:hypothetical protein
MSSPPERLVMAAGIGQDDFPVGHEDRKGDAAVARIREATRLTGNQYYLPGTCLNILQSFEGIGKHTL